MNHIDEASVTISPAVVAHNPLATVPVGIGGDDGGGAVANATASVAGRRWR